MRSILIVEDDIHISREMEETINRIGKKIKILTVLNGEDALQIAKSMAIDIFIIDIMLPDWDGIELAKKIRKSYPYNPIIIESSIGDSSYQNKVLREIKNIDFFKKPFSSTDFLATVHYAINLTNKLDVKKLYIKQNNRSRIFMLQDILYIEKVKSQKKVHVVFYNPKINDSEMEEFVGYTLSTLLELSEDELFRCHKSFLINPKMIERLNYGRDTVTLKYTTMEIPIGKTFKNKIALLLGG